MENSLCSQIRRCNIAKIIMFLTFFRFKAIFIKVQLPFFAEMDKLTLKLMGTYMKLQGTSKVKTILKKTKVVEFTSNIF